MTKKRHTLEIVGDILSLAVKGIRKTKLMRASNISFELLRKYTDMLASWKLIELKDNRIYLTPKGYTVLRLIKKLEELKNEEIITSTELERLLPIKITDDEVYPREMSGIEKILSTLKENGIQYKEVDGIIYVHDLEICEEEKCKGNKIFPRARRLMIGKKFSILVDSGQVKIIYNVDLSNLLWDMLKEGRLSSRTTNTI